MSLEVAARLRSLAQDHHDGRLDLAAYRALRAPLLDSLALNGRMAAAADITQPRDAARQALRDAITRPGRPRVVAPASAEGPLVSSRRLRQLAITLAVAIVIVAAVGVSMWIGRKPRPSVSTEAPTPTTTAGVQTLLREFVATGDWSDARVTTLNAALLELGRSQIGAATHNEWFLGFVDELRRRLKEQQALSPSRLAADNSPLAALAVTVGLDLNSPDAALHIAPLPPPPAPEIKVAAGDHAVPHLPQQPAQKKQAVPAATHDETVASAVVPPPVAQDATATTVDACRVELVRSRRPLCHDALPGGVDGPEMALIPAGAFDMGSTAASEEEPVHHVTLARPFAVGVNEVSQGEFKQFCDSTHRSCASQPWEGDDYPVVNVSWDEATAYADWLSGVTHHHYSLPTEAQWEYAARAGSTGPYPNGSATLSPTDANYSMLQRQTTAARRSQRFNANAFRLLHTVGNVREWVEDDWTRNFDDAPTDGAAVKSAQTALHVVRGGSYTDGPTRLRLSLREGLAPGTRDVTTGFRIVRELQ
jgi:formylglycine-generating enzyme required for sulfatase activity